MQTENTELVTADLLLIIEDKEIDIMSHGVWQGGKEVDGEHQLRTCTSWSSSAHCAPATSPSSHWTPRGFSCGSLKPSWPAWKKEIFMVDESSCSLNHLMRIANLSASVSLRLLLKSATTVVGGKGGASEAPGRDCATLNKRPAYLFFCQIISRSDLSTTHQTTKPQDAKHQHFQHQQAHKAR